MKYNLSVVLFTLAILLFSCKKVVSGDSNTPQPPPVIPPINYTPSPTASLFYSNIMAFASGTQYADPLQIHTNFFNYNDPNTPYTLFNSYYNSYTANSISLDKYASTLAAFSGSTFSGYYSGNIFVKTFMAISNSKNYVDFKLVPPVQAGSFNYDFGSGIMVLQNNGQLTLPPYSFGTHPGSVTFAVYSQYFNPSVKDYIVSIPCYPMADVNGKRVFLDSYGIYQLVPAASDNSNFDIDFNSNVNVSLKLPIPSSLISTAPDSIPCWFLNVPIWNQAYFTPNWIQRGYATKTGNFYQKQITQRGYWNFAVPTNGVYITVHLKSSQGASIPNARLTFKSGVNEIADIRTDAEGNALIFVPTNTPLTVDAINDFYNSPSSSSLLNQNFGTFNSSQEITYTLPYQSGMATSIGNVFNCDGTPLKNGSAVINYSYSRDSYKVPISNGYFQTANWTYPNSKFFASTIDIIDSNGNTVISNYKMLAVKNLPPNQTANYYTCTDAPFGYAKYQIDSTNFSIIGNVNASSPRLTLLASYIVDTIVIDNNGKGVKFLMEDNPPYYDILGKTIQIDNATYSINLNGNKVAYYYRDDKNAGGFKEGYFSIDYFDSNNFSHTVSGIFRLKRF
ncbi:hypothetical protein [Parasediminibacterium sp. JCM 36343]|uniref:hypothetical protein n=1 Tax=Parasediminibacterium sp. JCM 36343 TaxID=3374279 RepID=UPI00397D6C5A